MCFTFVSLLINLIYSKQLVLICKFHHVLPRACLDGPPKNDAVHFPLQGGDGLILPVDFRPEIHRGLDNKTLQT